MEHQGWKEVSKYLIECKKIFDYKDKFLGIIIPSKAF